MAVRLLAFLALLLALFATLVGCEPPPPERESPLPDQDCEYLLALVVDMSGSFYEEMRADGGRAHRFLLKAVDGFFRNRIGSSDRILLAQISAKEKALLWDGSPRTLRETFPSAREFRDYLVTKSDPAGSRVHDSISDTLDYVTDFPGVMEKKTKSAVFVLSDMDENFPEPEKSTTRLKQSLARYARTGGAVGFYWVDQTLVPTWRQNLRQAGLKSFVVESEIVADPPLPTFE